MEKIFVNHTNNPSDKWSAEQKIAAEIFGKVIDMTFPEILPGFDTAEVREKVMKNLNEI